MIKILVADDEKWVRAIITNIILKETSTFLLVGEATNGAEALELCLALSPDILLTDIRMPKLDGLDLILKINQNLPRLKTVIISGYDEFNYAQKALQLGAFDYLLKPIEEENLIEILYKARKIIIEENESIEREKLLKVQHAAGFNLLREKFLNDLLKENVYLAEKSKKQFKHFGINLNTSPLAVIVISIDDYSTKIKNSAMFEKENTISKFKLIMARVVRRYLHGYIFLNNSKENEFIVIYNPSKHLDIDYIHKVLCNTQIITGRRLNITFSAGISSEVKEISNLHNIYIEAAEILKYRMVKGKGSLLCSKNLKAYKVKEFSFSKDIVNEIIVNIELTNTKNICSIIDNLFEQATSYNEIKPELLKSAFWKLIIDVINGINSNSSCTKNLYEYNNYSVYEKIKHGETLDDINNFLKSFFTNYANTYINKWNTNNQNPIIIAKSYIENNYNKDLTLELISGYVFLSSTYFSELFKKEVGLNFIEYITKLRIEEAKRLLKETNMKTYEISEKVGYSDTKYFSKLFKKYVGTTTSEYKAVVKS